MEFWLMWISVWILLIVIEVFLLTLDFLAMWMAAIFTWVIWYILGFDFNSTSRTYSAIVFVMFCVINILITRSFFLPMLRTNKSWDRALSTDSMIGEKVIVQIENGKKVIFLNWLYRNIKSWDELNPGDTVEIVDRIDNTLNVIKVM